MATLNRLFGTSKYDLLNQQFSRWTVEEESVAESQKSGQEDNSQQENQAQSKNTKMEILRGNSEYETSKTNPKGYYERDEKRGYSKTKKEN